jgi:hypothetical protein
VEWQAKEIEATGLERDEARAALKQKEHEYAVLKALLDAAVLGKAAAE